MITVRHMQTATLLQWVVRLKTAKQDERWKLLPESIFHCFGKDFICFFSNVKSRQFKGLETIQSHFWKKVLQTWLDMQRTNQSSSSLLWNNSSVNYQGNVLFFPSWIKSNMLYVEDMYGPDGIISYNEVCNKMGAEEF